MTVVAWFREGLARESREGLARRLAERGYEVVERGFRGEVAPEEDLSTSLAALHDESARRLVFWFHDARGVLMKRLRSAPTAGAVEPLFEPGFEWAYSQDKGVARVEIAYGEGAPAERLGGRVLGLHAVLAKVDKKSLGRWVDKFLGA